MLAKLMGQLVPYQCLNCGIEGELVCVNCLDQIVIAKRPTCFRCSALSADGRTCASCRPRTRLAGVSVASHYDGPIKELVQLLKYQSARPAAAVAARLMTPLLAGQSFDLVTAVPTSAGRQRRRGYNQAELIARSVAHRMRLPYSPLLGRVTDVAQVGESRRRRLEQVRGIFYPLREKLLFQANILIIDDVLTTGATMSECAAVLRGAGAKRVWGAVLAKH